jgi:hypothetical protein
MPWSTNLMDPRDSKERGEVAGSQESQVSSPE